jgi:hypothetical protein
VARWAEKLQVSTSGYYYWQSGKEARAKRDEREKGLVRKIFKEGEGCYGADRIVGIIRRRGGHMGRTKASRYMTELGLSSIHNRRRSRSLTNSKKARGAGYPN